HSKKILRASAAQKALQIALRSEPRQERGLIPSAPLHFTEFDQHLWKQRPRHNDRLLNPDVAARHLVDEPFRRRPADVDAEMFRALNEDRGVRVSDGRMLELPNRIATRI